jgi:predicted mannosyl-3-phosphoglycerate phosphatase (HAD superfamily)
LEIERGHTERLLRERELARAEVVELRAQVERVRTEAADQCSMCDVSDALDRANTEITRLQAQVTQLQERNHTLTLLMEDAQLQVGRTYGENGTLIKEKNEARLRVEQLERELDALKSKETAGWIGGKYR